MHWRLRTLLRTLRQIATDRATFSFPNTILSLALNSGSPRAWFVHIRWQGLDRPRHPDWPPLRIEWIFQLRGKRNSCPSGCPISVIPVRKWTDCQALLLLTSNIFNALCWHSIWQSMCIHLGTGRAALRGRTAISLRRTNQGRGFGSTVEFLTPVDILLVAGLSFSRSISRRSCGG